MDKKDENNKVSPWFEKISRYYLKQIAANLDDISKIVKEEIIVF